MPLRMSWRWDRYDSGCQFAGGIPLEHDFRGGLRDEFIAMNDPPRPEVIGILFRIRDIIAGKA